MGAFFKVRGRGFAVVSIAIAIGVVLVGCAEPSDTNDDDAEPASTSADLQSAPLADSDMKPIPTPAGMPKPWEQPDSTGFFEEQGKCGPTAVANALLLYGINASPQQVDQDGVHWYVGTRGINVEQYMQDYQPQLHCTLEHPEDGAAFLRSELAGGHPIMVWYNTQGGFLESHWVTVVGRSGQGANELAIVMSWGRYYTIPMNKLDDAWRNVYLIRHPSVVCTAVTNVLVH